MKTFLLATLSGLALAGTLGVTTASAAPGQGDAPQQYQQQYQRPNAAPPAQAAPARRVGGRDHNNRGKSWRDPQAGAAWDQAEHNGYYRNNVWRFGPPPTAQMGRKNVRLGYRPWARGQRLGYYNSRYAEVDYQSQHLRAPPRGYHWVRSDDGDFLLAAIVSGLIAQVIMNTAR